MALVHEAPAQPEAALKVEAAAEIKRTLASRFIILILCLAIVLSTLVFGTVHGWSLAIFQAGAGLLVVLWAIDGWQNRALRISRNVLQLPLLGLLAIGLVQLLPIGAGHEGAGALSVTPVQSLSLDPYATRSAVTLILSLFIYFAAALIFIDSPGRLRLLVRTITIFGFLLAVFSLIQSFLNPSQIYWIRQPPQSIPFGPFINRHHFAGYMELALALPLGVLFSGGVERDRRLLYGFAAAIMAITLIVTGSRGGMLSLAAEILFLVAISTTRQKHRRETEGAAEGAPRVRAALMRLALGFGLVLALFTSVLFFGGEAALNRLVGTINSDDPTSGRLHFWRGAIEVIRHHPLTGAGLGAFGVAYTRYDTGSGTFRLDQAHNDYLQVLSDAGVVGAVLGIFFIVALFRMGLARMLSRDNFRRGVAIGALAGCFGVLIHSFFDFTLHITANALLFLVLAGLATINGRVEQASSGHRRRRRRRRHRSSEHTSSSHDLAQEDKEMMRTAV